MRLAALTLALAVLSGCFPEGADPVGPWARSVSWLRASANGYLAEQNLAAAESDLRRALAMPVPTDPRAPPLLQDVDFALGSILLARGDARGALEVAERGVKRTREPTVFLANLHALQGIALEAMNRPLEAAERYHEALLLHQKLYDALLAGADER